MTVCYIVAFPGNRKTSTNSAASSVSAGIKGFIINIPG